MGDVSEIIFDFRDTAYIEAIWFVAWDETDWMAVVYRQNVGEPWQAKYRFRYYKDAEAFGSTDQKSTFRVKTTENDGSEEARRNLVLGFDVMANVIREMKAREHAQLWKVDVQGGPQRFEEVIVQQSWAHVRVIPGPPTDAVQ